MPKSFALYIINAIDESETLNREIVAKKLGYSHQSIFSLIKQKRMKFQLNHVPKIAKMLKEDQAKLTMMYLKEYHPPAYKALL